MEWDCVALYKIFARSPRRISYSDVRLAELPSLIGKGANGFPYESINRVPSSLVLQCLTCGIRPIFFMHVTALPEMSTFCPYSKSEGDFSRTVMEFSRLWEIQQARVGPAMPEPTIRMCMVGVVVWPRRGVVDVNDGLVSNVLP